MTFPELSSVQALEVGLETCGEAPPYSYSPIHGATRKRVIGRVHHIITEKIRQGLASSHNRIHLHWLQRRKPKLFPLPNLLSSLTHHAPLQPPRELRLYTAMNPRSSYTPHPSIPVQRPIAASLKARSKDLNFKLVDPVKSLVHHLRTIERV